jgi:6-pyruvoyltetrahydropterin/6-carboxytetrahydropterin synthase
MAKFTDCTPDYHLITREIGIDAAHRIPDHKSKCCSIHGHRYMIQATCKGPLFMSGEQRGMVLDFGFLKEVMMQQIDKLCDHGTIMFCDDPFLCNFIWQQELETVRKAALASAGVAWLGIMGKMYIVPFVPTAENLARHWFELMKHPVRERSHEQADLVHVKVWETPNCSAMYSATGMVSVHQEK